VTITLSGTTYSVTGSHTYTKRGNHTITTTVTELSTAVDKMGDSDDGHSWKRQDAVQLRKEANGQGGSGTSPSVDSSSTGAGVAAVAGAISPTSAVASVMVSPAENSRPTQTVRPVASTSVVGTGTGIAALDPSVIAQGDTNGIGLSPSLGTSGAAWRRRFGGRWM
jgi:hypothetical protein